LAPEGMNAIVFGGEKGGRNQKSTACSEGYIVRSLFSLFIVYDDSYDIILTVSWRQYQNKPQPSVPFPISFPKIIAFIPSGAKTQKKEILPYPRCGLGAYLRCG